MPASTIYLQDIADAVLEARTAANMSQIQVAKAKDCSQSYVCQIEKHGLVPERLATLKDLAQIIDADWLRIVRALQRRCQG